ncbi:MAG: cadmium-translocating P-type ATPase [Solobacterium sp.]|nr:cadmium-translocating P-type ATPase [Solobacterium sp.]
METATYRFQITGIDCADCAAKLERKIADIEGLTNVSLSFMNEKLVYDCDHDEGREMEEKVRALIAREEPDAVMTSLGHKHHHEEHDHHHEEHEECHCHEDHDHEEHDACQCHHDHEEHHHDHEETATYMFRVTGIDCADCAAKLERKIADIEGLSNVSLSFMNEKLVYDCDHDAGREMEEKVRALIAKEEPDAVMTSLGHKHHHEEHEDHEHHEHHEMQKGDASYMYAITGIDCADCTARLEGKLAGIAGVHAVNISFMNSTLQYECDPAQQAHVHEEILKTVSREEPDAEVTAYERKAIAREEKREDNRDKVMLMRLSAGAVLFAAGLLFNGMPRTCIMLVSYLILGYDVLLKAFKGIGRGQLFDEHFLMAVATIAAIYLGDYSEAAGVMLFYQIGEYFQDLAVRRSRKSIGDLMNIRADHAEVLRHGTWLQTDPEDIRVGETVRVKPGERIPLDGVVTGGSATLDTASLTGEAKPVDVDPGDEVISGSINQSGVLEIRVTKVYTESTVARILDLVENQENRKASQENFITKFSRVYTPAVVFAAIAVAVIVSLMGLGVQEGVRRACTFLVISCPCALVISIPLSFFAGIGGLSSAGILVKGANVVESIAKIENVIMDKTGTLTSGKFRVIHTEGSSELLECAAYAESYSHHPIAEGVKEAYGRQIDDTLVSDVREIPGRGIVCMYKGHQILAGNEKLMRDYGIACTECTKAGSAVYAARDNEYLGCIILADTIKEEAKEAVREMTQNGRTCVIVSGDRQEIVDLAKEETGCKEAYGACMPQDKVAKVQAYCAKGITAFVGDGVNDAPVITAADVGFAMGALGSEAAIEAADVVLMDDQVSKVPFAINASKRILRIANENIYGAIAVKAGTLILGAFGIANMWMAIFADTGVAMICVLNSLRLLRTVKKKNI